MQYIRTQYLDASALVKLAIEEDHSQKLRAYCGRAVLSTTSLCFMEALGVLKGKWTHGRLSQEQYLAACEELVARARTSTLEVEDIGIFERDVYDQAEALATKHCLDISDAFQLLTLKHGMYAPLEGESRPTLVTADKRLAKAAISEGLQAWDCVHEPLP
ncbi:MAG: type II toxin-antitoxin system VapC family toxin [Sulfuricaulis sp.]|uniref:type II toxin-antitoxin system VapC family toxin n=1 Tax=Sulfuricaulis sp. TaxID=2003553 RepID=UPI0026015C20|nr:type II toxin-antitoxin system VapC family toxin [Sulfuricaulis sp.]MCR4347851.1 type II toxin-antitoxin system VapC family toxin [Sulfuricaulis sp.]